VQGLLDLALQRSSCESDPYRERLFVYIKEEDKVSFSGFASGIVLFFWVISFLFFYRTNFMDTKPYVTELPFFFLIHGYQTLILLDPGMLLLGPIEERVYK
jgi:hypothetical protein